MTIVCWSVKGGSGTTVTASSLARVLADRDDRGALLVDTQGDSLLVLGHDAPTRGVRSWLASDDDVDPAVLNLLSVDVGHNLKVLPAGEIPESPPRRERWHELAAYLDTCPEQVVVDVGTLSPASRSGRRTLLETAVESLLVIRPCYLAVRRAIDFPVRPTGIVLLNEIDRLLSADDVAAALGVDVVATIQVDPRIARTIDSGLLGSRIPRPLLRAYRHVAS